jgi:hypothetical protein
MAALAAALAAALLLLSPAAGEPAELQTADGLRLVFGSNADLSAASIDDHPLAPTGVGGGGFSVRSYTAPTRTELLHDPDFSAGTGWIEVGGGFRRNTSGGITLHNAVTNVTSAAQQRVVLPSSVSRSALSLRLSGWAATDGLVSNGTCADDGGCRLHDTFGLSCAVEYSDGSVLGPPLLAPAVFQSGAHGPQYSFTSLDIPPNAASGATIVALLISAELRGYAGTATFHNASLTLFPQIPFEAAGPTGALRKLNSSALALTATTPASSPLSLALDATLVALPTHVRVDGRVALAKSQPGESEPESAAGDDHAITLRFAVPVDGTGWLLGLDADTSSTVNATGSAAGGRRSRGYYDGAGEEGTTEGEVMVPPFASDWYPFLSLTSPPAGADAPTLELEDHQPKDRDRDTNGIKGQGEPDLGGAGGMGLAIGVPMERTVYISRADYTPPPQPSAASPAPTTHDLSSSAHAEGEDDDEHTQASSITGLLSIEFDLAISPRSAVFNSSTAFSFVLFKLDQPSWGFRCDRSTSLLCLHSAAVYCPNHTTWRGCYLLNKLAPAVLLRWSGRRCRSTTSFSLRRTARR